MSGTGPGVPRLGAAVALLLALWPAVAGCAGSGSAAEGRREGSGHDPATGPQPSADEPDAAFPVVEDVVIEATDLADELFQDPTVVGDGDAALRELAAVYTADSPTPAGVLAQLRALNDKGQRYRPGPSGRLRDVGVYRMQVVDRDTVALRVCAVEDVEVVDAAGSVVERRSQVTQGDGWALRAGGVWRFAGIDPDETATLPIAPGSAPTGFCDQLLGGTGP
ncbi:MAG TPA: hypothetical protein VFI47_24255 [Acidimicrobiales bacterium]|nr:hypothetical protein [Acidimicrobiales bacterium]